MFRKAFSATFGVVAAICTLIVGAFVALFLLVAFVVLGVLFASQTDETTTDSVPSISKVQPSPTDWEFQTGTINPEWEYGHD